MKTCQWSCRRPAARFRFHELAKVTPVAERMKSQTTTRNRCRICIICWRTVPNGSAAVGASFSPSITSHNVSIRRRDEAVSFLSFGNRRGTSSKQTRSSDRLTDSQLTGSFVIGCDVISSKTSWAADGSCRASLCSTMSPSPSPSCACDSASGCFVLVMLLTLSINVRSTEAATTSFWSNKLGEM